MICINRVHNDPYLNLATEEYVLKNISEDVFMVWHSLPSVIVGKHQNTFAEINMEYISENNIPVIRRLSGGGTVYHDLGNINYTLIRSEASREKLIDFKKFTQPIIEFLNQLEIKADFNGKNNLFVGEKKISGNAAQVHKNRVIHHGTLLFDSNISKLEKSIKQSNKNITDKAVQSVRSTVTNIRDFLQSDMDSKTFKQKFQKYIANYYDVSEIRNLTNDELSIISELASEKYQQWKWNYGYSPSFEFKNKMGNREVELQIKNGLIQEANLNCNTHELEQLNSALIGIPHNPTALIKAAKLFVSEEEIDQLIKLFGFYKTKS